MKIKIGCVIAYNKNHNNYGTSLQGFATIKKIKDLGYECEIIRYSKHLSILKKIRLFFIMLKLGGGSGKIQNIKIKIKMAFFSEYAQNIKLRTKAVNLYKASHLELYFINYNGYKNLQEGSKKYNAILVGSDQVWTPISLYGKYYNLLFVDENIRKISYASSFGVSSIPDFQKIATGEYLNRFNYISVRELSGKQIVETLSHNKAELVVDPTMLLTRKEWDEEIQTSYFHENVPYIFCYFLGRNKEARIAVNKLKEKTGYKIITIRHMDEYNPEDEKFGDEAPYNVDPNDFIQYIKHASYVCTDSFHCSVFSILFEKKFMTFYRFKKQNKNSRNSRIDSLLLNFGLKDRLYNGNIISIENEIDYKDVNIQLNKLRTMSLSFLTNALKF